MSLAIAEIEQKVRARRRSDKSALIRLLISELEGPLDPELEGVWIAEAKQRHQELLDGCVKGDDLRRMGESFVGFSIDASGSAEMREATVVRQLADRRGAGQITFINDGGEWKIESI